MVPMFEDHGYINLKTNAFFQFLNFLLNDAIGTEGPLNVNYILRSIKGDNGEISIKGHGSSTVISLNQTVAGIGEIEVQFFGGNITNLDTWR